MTERIKGIVANRLLMAALAVAILGSAGYLLFVERSGVALAADSDGDGLDDLFEQAIGTDPYEFDTDQDGAGDGFRGAGARYEPPRH
jgi:hypothetical protein